MRLRHSVRGLVVDPDDRLLLYATPLGDATLWVPPGGGIEQGETLLEALRRELSEEAGLVLTGMPPHVWHRESIGVSHYLPGFDGAINDYYLVRLPAFTAQGTLTPDQLAAENVGEFRWWRLPEIAESADIFSPRELLTLLPPLLAGDLPASPTRLAGH
ncbi:NUDIX domain-containing protein [Paractinoplanes hotanensis]|uniref:NUDIX domain-containing protein n=1 Tax=Paractinoplanes hotanensis TaxID=2906497 RepID=A0ABT0Y6A7_9ACTN|nr:NUDIX domain-containing protein [Actinoplanes hotanensis]MCM4081563.1 NUDIX domain-containing protein [Actinoplanes hotanensis]